MCIECDVEGCYSRFCEEISDVSCPRIAVDEKCGESCALQIKSFCEFVCTCGSCLHGFVVGLAAFFQAILFLVLIGLLVALAWWVVQTKDSVSVFKDGLLKLG